MTPVRVQYSTSKGQIQLKDRVVLNQNPRFLSGAFVE